MRAKEHRRKEADQQKRRSTGSLSKLSIKELETRMEKTEARIREIDESMMDPEVYTDGKRTKKLQNERNTLASELEPMEFEWSCRAEDD
jgi:hypothetical protein